MFLKRSFFRPFDAICLTLIAAAAAWGFLSFSVADGAKAVVYLSEKKYAWYDLAGDKHRIQVPTRIGPVWLEVGGGEVRVAESPCPNKICVKTGRVRHAHGEIICVPAHMLVAIEGASDGKQGEVDAVTF